MLDIIPKVKTLIENTLATGTIVAIGIGGSKQLGLEDAASDTDIIVFVIDRDQNDISTQLQLYDTSSNTFIDVLIRDVDTLTKFNPKWIYGWGSFTWYQTALWYLDSSSIIIYDNRMSDLIKLVYENRSILFYCLLVGYYDIINRVLIANKMPEFKNSEIKSIYHICFIYNQEIKSSFNNKLLYKIKRNSLNTLTNKEFTKIQSAIKTVLETYNINNTIGMGIKLEQLNNNIAKIWK